MPNDQQQMAEYFEQQQVQQNKGQFRQQTVQQYYRYLNLLKRTNNFCKDFNVYRNLSDHDFQDLALIGWIFEVDNLKIRLEQGTQQFCMVPIVYSNIKEPFKNYQESSNTKPPANLQGTASSQTFQPSKRTSMEKPLSSATQQNGAKPALSLQPHLRRPLLLLKSLYTKHFIKAFNQIIKESKQCKKCFSTSTHNSSSQINNPVSQIEWIYAFTGLRLVFQGQKVYWLMTDKTKIVAIDMKFYIQIIQNLEKSVGFPYSYLTLNVMPKNYDAQTIQQGYPLTALQTQASIIDKITFTGILREFLIEQPSPQNSRKDKQIVLTFLEDSTQPFKSMLGIAKVIIKLSLQQNQEQLFNFFKIGFLYLVTNAVLSISDNINIVYKLKQKWRSHIFQLYIQKSPQINQQTVKDLPVVDMAWMKLANVNRNIVKVRVDFVRCEHFYGKLVCTQCKHPLNNDQFCSAFCGKNYGELKLWVIALVSDQSTYAQLSLQTNQTLQFFNFTHQHILQIRRHILAQNSRKMVKLFNSFTYYSNRSSSEPILSFQKEIAAKFISKTLIGIPRYNLNQNFSQQLTEQQKVEFQQSLQTSKQYMKKNKVHFNGYVKKVQKNIRKTIPFIKVLQVLNQ